MSQMTFTSIGFRLCKPKIRSEHNDNEVRPIPARIRSSHGAGFCGKEAHPSLSIDACEAHCNISHSLAGVCEGVFH